MESSERGGGSDVIIMDIPSKEKNKGGKVKSVPSYFLLKCNFKQSLMQGHGLKLENAYYFALQRIFMNGDTFISYMLESLDCYPR